MLTYVFAHVHPLTYAYKLARLRQESASRPLRQPQGEMTSLTTEAAASAAAGVASTILGHPLDCVKVRLQTAKQSGGRLTTLGCARQMLQQEGASAFARGVGPPLANAMLLNTVMFVCFAEARRHLPQTTVGSLLAGGFSGVAQAFLTTPLDWLKIQVRVQARFGFGFGLGLGSGIG